MVRHQNVCVDHPAVAAGGAPESQEEDPTVFVVEEDRLLVVASCANVVAVTGDFEARAIHAPIIVSAKRRRIVCGQVVPLSLQRLPPDMSAMVPARFGM